jgi:hypothetical protein
MMSPFLRWRKRHKLHGLQMCKCAFETNPASEIKGRSANSTFMMPPNINGHSKDNILPGTAYRILRDVPINALFS